MKKTQEEIPVTATRNGQASGQQTQKSRSLTELECLRIKALQQDYQIAQMQAQTLLQQKQHALDAALKALLTEHDIHGDDQALYVVDLAKMRLVHKDDHE